MKRAEVNACANIVQIIRVARELELTIDWDVIEREAEAGVEYLKLCQVEDSVTWHGVKAAHRETAPEAYEAPEAPDGCEVVQPLSMSLVDPFVADAIFPWEVKP